MGPRTLYQRDLRFTRRWLGRCRYCPRPSGRFTRCLQHRLYFSAYKKRRREATHAT